MAIVRVWSDDSTNNRVFNGTAFFIDNFRLVTAKHVVEGIDNIYLNEMPNGGILRVSEKDITLYERDIAVINLKKSYEIDKKEFAQNLPKDLDVEIHGYFDETSELNKFSHKISGYLNEHHTFSIQQYTSKGMSGSPVFYEGKICGIVQARDKDKNITYIIPISELCIELEMIESTDIVDRLFTNLNKVNAIPQMVITSATTNRLKYINAIKAKECSKDTYHVALPTGNLEKDALLVVEITDRPDSFFDVSHTQIKETRDRLAKISRLDAIISQIGVSKKILDDAVNFTNMGQDEKIKLIAKRVEAKVVDNKLNLPENFPLSVKSIIIKFVESEDVIDIKNELKHSGILEGKMVLILAKDESLDTVYKNLTSDKTNMFITPRSTELTKLLLSPNPKEVFSKIISSQIALTQISPYQIGGGVNDESIFFGREKVISHILNKNLANYIIIGGRQVGKSSLLKAIERRYKKIDEVECFYISALNENLLEDIKLELDKEEFSDKAFAKFINSSKKRYLFLIDEADDFVKYEKAHEYKNLKFFRALSERNNASFILAGFWETDRYTFSDDQSPIKNFASIVDFEELEFDSCMDLSIKPMKNLGLEYDSKESVEWMIEKLGQRANLIQIVCDYLIENIDSSQKIITKQDIKKVLKNKNI